MSEWNKNNRKWIKEENSYADKPRSLIVSAGVTLWFVVMNVVSEVCCCPSQLAVTAPFIQRPALVTELVTSLEQVHLDRVKAKKK